MIEVVIDSIRVSLMSQHRVVILKEANAERFLSIWIGPYEAEAITVSLQELEVSRPLTHDLLRNLLAALGVEVKRVDITELRDDVFHANIILNANGRELSIDSRPSDALALAVRVHVPIFVSEAVMEEAATVPEKEVSGEEDKEEASQERLEVFKDFLEGLDMDDIDSSGEEED
jgi:bifunctional DNase/RNase